MIKHFIVNSSLHTNNGVVFIKHATKLQPIDFLPLFLGEGSPSAIISKKNCIKRDRKGWGTVLCTEAGVQCNLSKRELVGFWFATNSN